MNLPTTLTVNVGQIGAGHHLQLMSAGDEHAWMAFVQVYRSQGGEIEIAADGSRPCEETRDY